MGYTKSWNTFAEQPLCSDHKWVPLEGICSQPKHIYVHLPVMSSTALSIKICFGEMLQMNQMTHLSWHAAAQRGQWNGGSLQQVAHAWICYRQTAPKMTNAALFWNLKIFSGALWGRLLESLSTQWVCSHCNNSRKHMSDLLAGEFNTWSDSREKVQNP